MSVGSASHEGAQVWDRWILARRKAEAECSADGRRWILRTTPLYVTSMLVCTLLFLAFALGPFALVLFGKPKKPTFMVAIGGMFVLATAVSAGVTWKARMRRLAVSEKGIEDLSGGGAMTWEEVAALRTTSDQGLTFVSSRNTGITFSKYLDGLGRLREEMLLRVPELLVPLKVHWWLYLHPLELLPPLEKAVAALPEPEEPARPVFRFKVEKVESPVAFGSAQRTSASGVVLEGVLRIGDRIVGAGGRSFVLQIMGALASRKELKKGEKVKLLLYGTGHAWIHAGAVLSGGPCGAEVP